MARRTANNTTTTTTTTTTKPARHGLFRRKVRQHPQHTHPHTHHQKRKTTIGDKIAGGLKKLKGTITRNPAVKAAGTRRMHGTDGRGSHRY
ncbi:hypothetical protein VPNG_05497 [Cytospora leucostoma]|uniref:Uncharacterized protein n=1 Tax=Cytospora leucostoma TaxID=1230097 RepID=A0A423XBI9_9PEZI|nr:hypothetical protein VPNG_05497 [Cytospora leucostoma]